MADKGSLRRLGGGRWKTRDGRFAIEPQSGTWVIVDNDQTDELGLPLVRGPFGTLTAAKDAIEAARSEGPKASPLAERIELARRSEPPAPAPKPSKPGTAGRAAAGGGSGPEREPAVKGGRAPKSEPEPPKAPAPPEPRWLRELDSADQRRARDLIARLDRMGLDDPERVVRAEVADGQPALARLAVERALARALSGTKDPAPSAAARAAVRSIVGGADVELGVSWRLVDGEGRRIDKVDIPDK